MMEFWNNLDSRERKLVSLLGLFAFVFLIWLLAVRPLQDAKARAERGQVAAMNEHRIVAEGAPRLSSSTQGGALSAFDRNALVNAARESDLAITRVQPGQDGQLRVWFEDVPSPNVYNLLSRISAGYDVRITRAQINRRAGNQVSAQFTFLPN